MNVRRPECDEQPCRPMLRNARLNQTTILSGVMGPPRSDRMKGPVPVKRPPSTVSASRKIGMNRDQPATAVLGGDIAQLNHRTDFASGIEHHVPGQVGDLTGAQAALAASKTITRLRRGCRMQVVKTRRSLTSPTESIFACLPAIVSSEVRSSFV